MPNLPVGDEREIEKAKTSLEGMRRDLSRVAGMSRTISFVPSYAEDEKLFSALEAEARAVQGEVTALVGRVERFAGALGEIDPAWFACRKELVSLFSRTLTEFNSASGSMMLTHYHAQEKRAFSFLEELLTLRMYFNRLDKEIHAAYERMHKPIAPIKLQNDCEQIIISLAYDDSSTYEDKIAELIGSAKNRGTQVLAEAFLCQSDSTRMHRLFNGNKFRSCSTAT